MLELVGRYWGSINWQDNVNLVWCEVAVMSSSACKDHSVHTVLAEVICFSYKLSWQGVRWLKKCTRNLCSRELLKKYFCKRDLNEALRDAQGWADMDGLLFVMSQRQIMSSGVCLTRS
jgi:hypothetical protein